MGRTKTENAQPFCRLPDGSGDGAVCGLVFGTYLHGLFDSGELTAALADWLLTRKGLDPARRYKVTEQNVDKSCWWGNGNTYDGAFLSGGGFNPHFAEANTSAIFVLESE